MGFLNRDAILSTEDRRIVPVPVPEWGGDVYVRTMTAGERDRWELSVQGRQVEDVRATLIALTACDPDGVLLFSPSDVPALAAKSAPAMQRLFNESVKLNAISKEDVKELEKN